MAAKRFLSGPGSDLEQPPEKRRRTRPSFASVIGEVVMGNCLNNFFSALEPMLRRVVNEEVERGMRHGLRSLTRTPSFRIQALEPSTFKLVFREQPYLPIFTASKISDMHGNPLQILVVDARGGSLVPVTLGQPLKIEIVAVDGDFPPRDRDHWSHEEFENGIVKERNGKRPLLTGDVNITLRDGVASIGEIEFTDNSSWIRGRKFRVGARVVGGYSQGRIREAITQAFVVKDHRGELYKKHYPPSLEDEVWRLEKIGKDGAFHRRLADDGIKTVQDFLKLSTVDPHKLKRILGGGMSEKMWEVTIKHARTCDMGNKLYVYRGHNFVIVMNPICQVVRALIDDHVFHTRDLNSLNRNYIESLVREAYTNWCSLQEVEGFLNETALLTQGDFTDQCPSHNSNNNNNQAIVKSYNGYTIDKCVEGGNYRASTIANQVPICNNWQINSTFLCPSLEHGLNYSISESSSDGDLTPSTSFINHGI